MELKAGHRYMNGEGMSVTIGGNCRVGGIHVNSPSRTLPGWFYSYGGDWYTRTGRFVSMRHTKRGWRRSVLSAKHILSLREIFPEMEA